MSHLTKLKVKISDQQAAAIAREKMGWRVEHMTAYHTPFGGLVKNADVYKDRAGNVTMVVDTTTGEINVDTYYMREKYQDFCKAYSEASIAQSAADSGGWVENTYTDPRTNELVIEVALL